MQGSLPLVHAFLAGLTGDARVRFEPTDALEQQLARLLEVARAPWSEVPHPTPGFLGFLGQKVAEQSDPVLALEGLRVPELFLVWTCSTGDPRALDVFEARYMPGIDRVLARQRFDASFIDEIKQLLRLWLFVGQGGQGPGVTRYGGRG